MRLLSDYTKDVRTLKKSPGAYEWWYFDAMDHKAEYRIVAIFYEGNPFSPRYARAIPAGALAEGYPAASISVYQNNRTVYHSFSEFSPGRCRFDPEHPHMEAEKHSFHGRVKGDRLVYSLDLRETLPSGDSLDAGLTFMSPIPGSSLFNTIARNPGGKHLWNLVQPRAEVTGTVRINSDAPVEFSGTGYHDHNSGREPMQNEFKEWYWGRFHFESGTLIYYVVNGNSGRHSCAWLIGPQNDAIETVFETIELQDKGLNLFGLRSCRKILLGSEGMRAVVQLEYATDNGPFYQRFNSRAFLYAGDRKVETCEGISEYLDPSRISLRVFRPLVNMRIHYKDEGPHWVQRFPKLYRWTW